MLLCVLTVSDRCAQGQLTDTAGPAVVNLLCRQWPAAQTATAIVPDKENEIAARLLEWADMEAQLILTVGGTGLSPRDRTPEATLQVIDRIVPGLARSDARARIREHSLCLAFPRSSRFARQHAHC